MASENVEQRRIVARCLLVCVFASSGLGESGVCCVGMSPVRGLSVGNKSKAY